MSKLKDQGTIALLRDFFGGQQQAIVALFEVVVKDWAPNKILTGKTGVSYATLVESILTFYRDASMASAAERRLL